MRMTSDGAPISVAISGSPAHGQATLASDGALRFVPERSYVGGDTLSLTFDSAGRTTTIAVPVAITAQAKTKILSGPPASSTSHTATFTLYAEGGATLTCALSDSVHATRTLRVRWYVSVRRANGHGARQVLVASGSSKAMAIGVEVPVTVTPTAAGRRLLASASGPGKVRAVATFTPTSGATIVVTRRLTFG